MGFKPLPDTTEAGMESVMGSSKVIILYPYRSVPSFGTRELIKLLIINTL